MKRTAARSVLVGYSVIVGLLLLLPTLIVVPVSFTDRPSLTFPPRGWSTRWYENFFTNPAWYEATVFSLQIAAITTVLATALGTMAALALANGRGRWRAPARAILISPMIVPGVIFAIGIFYVFLRLGLTQTLPGFVLAHTVLAIPFVVVTVSAALQTFDGQLLRAAASLGASPGIAFFRITLPLISRGVLTGALFAFLTSFDEAIVSLFLAGPFTRTLPIQIYRSVTAEIDPTIAAASTVLLGTTTLVLLLFAVLGIKKERQ
ncbi:ABC transporter permease [Salinibacterium sp. ZJ450]|uniref:ABC transporter permease n=1 Tax=Salinibacterium sp. ZJ450 TaxID=2708338 RepID=UPI00142322CA|nr:ABC transporter permease [Salinibacterium sp. ZJ450]